MKTQTNCAVLRQGDSAADHKHVRQNAPIDLKKRELAEIPRSNREIATGKARREQKVRPL